MNLRDFLEHELLPGVTAEMVFTHPAHEWQSQGADKWRGGCPWHASKSGSSFTVNPRTLEWYCAGCHIGGGPLQYLYRLDGGNSNGPRGAEFVRYVRQLAGMAG